MKLIYERARLVATMATLVACLSLAPVAADQGGGSGGGADGGSTSSASSTSPDRHEHPMPGTTPPSGDQPNSSGSGSTGTGSDNGDHDGSKTETESNDDSLQTRANLLLSDKRQNGQEHSQTQRQQTCQTKQAQINGKITRLSTHAQQYLDNFNKIFSAVQAYQASQQLSVANYDSLVAAATAKQTAATTAVSNLKNVSVNIDCSATDPANSIATIETAAGDAKTALQAYRSSLRSLIEALLAAQKSAATTSTGTDTTGGNQ